MWWPNAAIILNDLQARCHSASIYSLTNLYILMMFESLATETDVLRGR